MPTCDKPPQCQIYFPSLAWRRSFNFFKKYFNAHTPFSVKSGQKPSIFPTPVLLPSVPFDTHLPTHDAPSHPFPSNQFSRLPGPTFSFHEGASSSPLTQDASLRVNEHDSMRSKLELYAHLLPFHSSAISMQHRARKLFFTTLPAFPRALVSQPNETHHLTVFTF